MGRGNICVHGVNEGLYYVDYDTFFAPLLDENDEPLLDKHGYPQNDYELADVLQRNAIELLRHDFQQRFPSFTACNIWLNNTCRAILENNLFFVGVEDNQWSLAIELLEKEQIPYCNGNVAGLQKRHFLTYYQGLRDVLFQQFSELGVYGGPWTSGRITRPEKRR